MKNKNLVGLNVLAWVFIICNGLTLIQMSKWPSVYSFLSRQQMNGIMFYAMIYCFVGIVCAVSLLQRKEWARKLILMLAILGIVDAIVWAPINQALMAKILSEPKTVGQIEYQYKASFDHDGHAVNLSEAEFVRLFNNSTATIAYIVIGLIEAVCTVYFIIVLFYFTRPKIRQRFAFS